MNEFDYGITVGMGLSIGVGEGSLGIDARYQHGLADTGIRILSKNSQNRNLP